MTEEVFYCNPCKYKTTKKHIYEKHLMRETHLRKIGLLSVKSFTKESTKINIPENASASANEIATTTDINTNNKEYVINLKEPINKVLYERANADFYKYMYDKDDYDDMTPLPDNETTTTTTIIDDNGNTITEKTTYSTSNSITDYDVHIDTGDFIKMMNTSLAELKSSGDRKAFVTNFFEYMFRHVTEIRHTGDGN
jgi:hypothetical protein